MLIPTCYQGIHVSTISEHPQEAEQYKQAVEHSLHEIYSGPSGQDLLLNIMKMAESGERKITVKEVGINHNFGTQAMLTESQEKKHRPRNFEQNKRIAFSLGEPSLLWKGEGTSAMIMWNPQKGSLALTENGSPARVCDGGQEDSFTVLAHELIHAQHIMKGTRKSGYDGRERYDSSTPAGKEENRAVGVGKYAYSITKQPSENSIRAEHGLPLRNKYGPIRARASE